ncbi:MAG: hypothetical protein ABI874_14100, partial [Chloroflexota bacterium]
MGRVVALITLLIVASCDAATPIPTSTSPPPSVTPAIGLPNRLSSFPRPPQDNGWGVHWAPTLFAQPPEVVDYFVGEAQTMGIKWVKFLNGDSDKLDHAHLVRTLVAHGMMPVMRVYQPFNEPYEHLAALTRAALPLGVRYIELYNEPNVAGRAGGWRDGEAISATRIAELWVPAADAVTQAGGYPGLPSLAPGGDYDDLQFLRDFLDELKARGRADLLQRAWLPLHNYFLNHPLAYPNDDVNLHNTPLAADEIARRRLSAEQIAAINTARLNARLPRAQGGYFVSDSIHGDSNGFRKFEAYEHIVVERVGFEIPIISTEGGAIAGAHEDPRYPPMTDDDVTTTTLAAYRTMIESAPAYYFAFTPWLLANAAGGHSDPRFEAHAWYKDRLGTTLP